MGNKCSCGEISTESDEVRVKVSIPRRPKEERAARSAAACRTEPRRLDFSAADPHKWIFEDVRFDGSSTHDGRRPPEFERVQGSIARGLETLRAKPEVYDGLFYQTDMTEWPEEQQKYTLVKRTGSGYAPNAGSGDAFTYVESKYQALQPGVAVRRDSYTDKLTYEGSSCGEPLCPGRGQGVADVPGLCIVKDVDPSDISQGSVGDCWLLSAISALAEYDGAIKKLFRKTRGIEHLPTDGSNKYVVSLYDVASWEEVDIEIDERLCSKSNGGGLLGCAPSVDGELWACYLEKAIAAHCGGWDKIDGGTCEHAFRLLLGCKDQYTFREGGGGFECLGAFNPNSREWEQLANSPHDGFQGLWPMEWPEVGGGGDRHMTLGSEELFQRMCMWCDEDYIMCCATKAGSDSQDTDGIVDGHAYSILDIWSDVAGTGINMIKVRNPWGRGEIKSGKWDDDGPGWDEYPAVKQTLKPVQADDGVFWLEESEFFKYFKTVYMCAMSMREYLKDEEAAEEDADDEYKSGKWDDDGFDREEYLLEESEYARAR